MDKEVFTANLEQMDAILKKVENMICYLIIMAVITQSQ